MRIHDLDDLVVVVAYAGELADQVTQKRDVPAHRRVGFDYAELFGEDAFDDKPAAVLLASGSS